MVPLQSSSYSYPQGFGAGKGKGFGSSGDKSEKAQGRETPKQNPARTLAMAFTCNKCEGRHTYMLNPEAYESGLVICQCKTCGVRHLIADNNNLLDVPEFGRNVEEYLQNKGEAGVQKASAPALSGIDLSEFDLAVGEDGGIQVSKRQER
ncbi:unnamed protein product [Chrysoparadoxa australica]